MGLTRNWHVEAWSVRDGMAFASYRPYGDLANADRTVFIGAPGLEAFPLGRVSPALWATRANFQDGLHSESGEEIGFKDLDGVKELVRRGYLAGGIGPGAGGGDEGPPHPPNEPEGAWVPDIGVALDLQFERLGERGEWFRDLSGIGDPQTRERVFESLVSVQGASTVVKHVRAFAAATIAAWDSAIRARNYADAGVADLARWIHVLVDNAALWQSPADFALALRPFSPLYAPHIAHDHYFGPYMRWGLPLDDTVTEELLFQIPCPRRPRQDPRIRRLSDKVFLAASVYGYFDANPDFGELIPALLFALTVTSIAKGPQLYPSDETRRSRLRSALEWLSEQMPQRQLPLAAESSLELFAWKELDRI